MSVKAPVPTINFNSDKRPDLSRLPPELREQVREPIPLRPLEFYDSLSITGAASFHRNVRINIGSYVPEPEEALAGDTPCVHINMHDYTGKVTLGTIIITTQNIKTAMTSMLRAHLQLGGTLDILEEIQAEARRIEERNLNAYTLDFSNERE